MVPLLFLFSSSHLRCLRRQPPWAPTQLLQAPTHLIDRFHQAPSPCPIYVSPTSPHPLKRPKFPLSHATAGHAVAGAAPMVAGLPTQQVSGLQWLHCRAGATPAASIFLPRFCPHKQAPMVWPLLKLAEEDRLFLLLYVRYRDVSIERGNYKAI
ncbi:hypothetical protein BS78_04G107600 [Paspalum vaginatum]|nr:hypothetical protein BS78_04G107600 [Paspalum vaginatum]